MKEEDEECVRRYKKGVEILKKTGNSDEAFAWFQSALDLAPPESRMQQKLKLLLAELQKEDTPRPFGLRLDQVQAIRHISQGLDPNAGVVVAVMGILMLPWFFINPFFWILTIIGLICILSGVLAPKEFYEIIRSKEGFKCRVARTSQFIPFSAIINIKLETKFLGATSTYTNGIYSGSRASLGVYITFVLTSGVIPVTVITRISFNKKRKPSSNQSVRAKIERHMVKWRNLLSYSNENKV